ncbi:MAG: hypothetical protein J6Q19_04785 [Bacteroidaceae bacterium]|nr:hypothetical protein [Bacteroidaceae bacterium]
MKFDATYSGKVYSMQNGEVYTLRNDGKFAYASAVYDHMVRVALTGYTATSTSGNTGYQTTSGGFIFLKDGWKYVGNVPVMQYSQAAAQALVNKIIKNNIQIVQNNLVCARYASKFNANQQAMIRSLQNRAEQRKNALQTAGLCANVQTSFPKGYADLSGYLEALMQGEAIGIATWVIVVIAATVVAATATAAYFAYQSFANESEADIKYSKELMAVLAQKLTPEEYNQLLKETKGIVTKAKIKQALGSYGNVLKWAVFAFAGYAAYRVIKNNM